MSAPQDAFKINLNQNLWGLVVAIRQSWFRRVLQFRPLVLVRVRAGSDNDGVDSFHDVRVHRGLCAKAWLAGDGGKG